MNKIQIFDAVVEICKVIFEDENLQLTLDSTAADFNQWDSLSHIQLILEIEKKFDLKLSLSELQNLKNINNIVELVSSKIA